ncbi:MAG: Testis-specific serine/threonine-protein kinase 4 [Marteilia pararefringens]
MGIFKFKLKSRRKMSATSQSSEIRTDTSVESNDSVEIVAAKSRDINNHEPREDLEGYKVGSVIGRGSYAVVKMAKNEKSKKLYAVKIISKPNAPQDFLNRFLPREIAVMKKIRSDRLIGVHKILDLETKAFLVIEFAHNGDLLRILKKQKRFSNFQVSKWSKEMIDGIDYMHNAGIVHRDLKCENILLDKSLSCKISDFGFARFLTFRPTDNNSRNLNTDQLSSTFCGSYAYAPPEVLRGIPYNCFLSDVWSLGVIIYTITYSRLPFDDSNHRKLLKQVMGVVKIPQLPDSHQKPLASSDNSASDSTLNESQQVAIRSMIQCQTQQRWSIHDVRQSQYYKNIGRLASKLVV